MANDFNIVSGSNNKFYSSDFYKKQNENTSNSEINIFDDVNTEVNKSSEQDFLEADGEYYLEDENNFSKETQESKDENNILNFIGKCGHELSSILIYQKIRPLSTMLVFMDNQTQLIENTEPEKEDTYYHARANAQAGQHFDILSAISLSIGREVWDIVRKNTWQKGIEGSFENVLDDSLRDLQADVYGLAQGLSHPFEDVDSILDKELLRKINGKP